MALSAATITYDLSDYGLADFDSRRTKVWATNNVNGPVVDTEGNTIHLGSANGTVNADGTGSITVPTPGTGSNPASWQTTIHVDYPDRNADRGRGSKSFGPFTITVSANLADLIEEQAVPPEYAGAIVAEMEAIRDETAVISGLTGEDAAVALLIDTPASDTATALSATYVAQTGRAGALFAINDGTGREVGDSILVDPTDGTGNDQLAHWQIKQAGKGRLFHFTSTADIGTSGVRDYIGMGVGHGGNGLLVSTKDDGSGRIGKGINTALQASAVNGSNALLVGQYNATSPAAVFETYVAAHAPVLSLVAHDAAAAQRLFRVQIDTAGTYVTTEYIDSQTGAHVFNVDPDFTTGMTVRDLIDMSTQTADQPGLRMKARAAQTANFIEVFNTAGSAYLFNVTSAGRALAARFAANTAGTTGMGTISLMQEGASLAGFVSRAHASAAGDHFAAQDSGGTVLFAIASDALPQWRAASLQQTTVGAAGGASALPATPTKYLKVKDSAGTTLVIPAYAVS